MKLSYRRLLLETEYWAAFFLHSASNTRDSSPANVLLCVKRRIPILQCWNKGRRFWGNTLVVVEITLLAAEAAPQSYDLQSNSSGSRDFTERLGSTPASRTLESRGRRRFVGDRVFPTLFLKAHKTDETSVGPGSKPRRTIE